MIFKAISSNTLYQVIPRRIKISKRLAQCMHPALPSGVHLKALETYDVIFSKTGPDRLAIELFIYRFFINLFNLKFKRYSKLLYVL